MRRHAGRLADRLARIGGRQAALVQRVAGLVHHGEHGLGEVGLVVAGGDPHVGRRAAGERMRRAVQPGVGEVEPEPLGQAPAQRLLRRDRETGPRAAVGGGLRAWRSSACGSARRRKAS